MFNPTTNTTESGKAEIILPLFDFFTLLKENGFQVTPQQIRESNLVITHFAPGVRNEAELADYLVPIFADNQEEQKQFYELFHRHFVTGKSHSEQPVKASENKRHWFKRFGWIMLLGIIVMLLITGYVYYRSAIIMKPYFETVNTKAIIYQHDVEPLLFNVGINDTIMVHTIMHPYREADSNEISYRVSYQWSEVANDTGNVKQFQQEGIYELKTFITFYKYAWLSYHDTLTTKIMVCRHWPEVELSVTPNPDSLFVKARVRMSVHAPKDSLVSVHWIIDGDEVGNKFFFDTVFQKKGDYNVVCKVKANDSSDACAISKMITLSVQDTALFAASLLPSPDASLVQQQFSVKSMLWWTAGAGAMLTMIGLMLTVYFNQQRRKRPRQLIQQQYDEVLQSLKGRKLPKEVPFHAKNYLSLPQSSISMIARMMRQRIADDQTMLDISQTVNQSIRSGGMFQPVKVPRTQQSEYLFLIDETNRNSQWVKLGEYLIEQLQKQNVLIEKYYYREEPAFCHNLNDPGGISLDKLSERYGHHVLLIFGDGNQFLHSNYPVMRDEYVQLLGRWRYKAILTPVSLPDWGIKEKSVLAVHIPVLPADAEGLLAFMQEIFSGEDHFLDTLGQQAADLYNTERYDFEDIDQLDAYCRQAQWANVAAGNPYSNILLQWLASLAVYPKIRWEMILAMGKSLLDKYGLAAELNYNNLLRISRISWVKNGQFPDYLRLELLKILSPEHELIARETVLALISEITPIELNEQHLAYEEMSIQQLTNQFTLYAHDPVKYAIYQEAKVLFEKLWKDQKVLDAPAKVYLENQKSSWSNLVRIEHQGEMSASNVNLASYFQQQDTRSADRDKKGLWLAGIFATLFLLSLIALVFLGVLQFSGSKRFADLMEYRSSSMAINFSLIDSSKLYQDKTMNLMIDTSLLQLKANDTINVTLDVNNAPKKLNISIDGELLLDSLLELKFTHYDVHLKNWIDTIGHQVLNVRVLFQGDCSYMSKRDKIKRSIEYSDDAIRFSDSMVAVSSGESNKSCLNAFTAGTSVNEKSIERVLDAFRRSGFNLVRMNQLTDYLPKSNEMIIFQDTSITLNAKIDLAVEISNTCQETRDDLVSQWNQQTDLRSKINLQIRNLKVDMKNVHGKAICLNSISVGSQVDRSLLNKVIRFFKSAGFQLTFQKQARSTMNSNSILVYAYQPPCTLNVRATMNGQRQSIIVEPGSMINLTGDFSLSNSNCTGCKQQLLIGIDKQGLGCLFNGIPKDCPEKTEGKLKFAFAAPEMEGIYPLYCHSVNGNTCDLQMYKGKSGANSFLLGTITVKKKEIMQDTVTVTYNRLQKENTTAINVNPGIVVKVRLFTNAGVYYEWKPIGTTKILRFYGKTRESKAFEKNEPGSPQVIIFYYIVEDYGSEILAFDYLSGNAINSTNQAATPEKADHFEIRVMSKPGKGMEIKSAK